MSIFAFVRTVRMLFPIMFLPFTRMTKLCERTETALEEDSIDGVVDCDNCSSEDDRPIGKKADPRVLIAVASILQGIHFSL
jgi:hypothetical protein